MMLSHTLSRREFLSAASATALTLAAHRQGLAVQPASSELSKESPPTDPTIVSLRLQTAAPLAAMKEFYGERLGLPIDSIGATEFTVHAGATPITFMHAESPQDQPWYHVAFNIPENKIMPARKWQLQRSKLLQVRAEVAGENASNDVADFSHWNAHSVFFWDPAGNLLEYIARHDLKNTAPGNFSPKDILYASEIGFVGENSADLARIIRAATGIGPYRNPDSVFLGSDLGLLLVLEKGRRPWAVFNAAARGFDIYPTTAVVRGNPTGSLSIPGLPYQITVV